MVWTRICVTPTGWPKAKRRGRCITTGRGRFETGPYAGGARGWGRGITIGRGRFETGPYARRARGWGRGITTGRGRLETGPYARRARGWGQRFGAGASPEEAGLKPAPTQKEAGLPDEGDDDEAKGEIGLADGGAGSLADGMDEVLSEAEDEAGDIPVERM